MDAESASTETIVCPRCESPDYVSLHRMTVQYRLPAEWFRCDVCGHLFSKDRDRNAVWDRISEPGWWVVGAVLAGATWLTVWDRISEPGWWVVGAVLAGATWLSWNPAVRVRHLFAQAAEALQRGTTAPHSAH
jgi:hypothetical protein